MDPALRSREREAERGCDLLVRPAFDVAQHDRRAILEWQGPEPGSEERLQLAPLSDGVGGRRRTG